MLEHLMDTYFAGEYRQDPGDMTMMRTGRITREELPTAVANELAVVPETDEAPTNSVSRFKSDFIVNSVIGRGGFGSIYLCTSRWDGMQYAVIESGGDEP